METGLSGSILRNQTGNHKENFVVLKIEEHRKGTGSSVARITVAEGEYLTEEEDK